MNVTVLTADKDEVKKIIEFLYAYIAPAMNACGVLTNTVNVAVFLNSTLTDRIYTYLLFNSIAQWLYCLGIISLHFPKCGVYCSTPDTATSYGSAFIDKRE